MSTWDLSSTKHHVLICNGGSCMRNGGEEVTQAIREEIKRQEVDDYIHTTRTRCNGRCQDACVVITYPEGIWYRDVTPELGKRIVEQHLINGEKLKPYISYSYSDQSFERAPDSLIGIKKVIV